uniref:Polyhydroxyalkanoate synthesis repressor PhaR n=1 Tax=Candidatus Kentrum sp. SD TaxID=2126332 RepID=A0A450Y4I4_9GAMM|nr:MAG: polyhydroxyalkanoate synthesis repressor PhaR [Candidatus Kentron sp. SD]VFK38571.1 MAG: polyhydroxyalkanoate synthesis repressor PhaR [Candidatus Kentron sp. SD]VFK78634.1 MAG: polyhydroxyalkanoate synthesis repressor PhaR [Candidatus Kentron sp. SD]
MAGKPRILKKYPNRRLYDTNLSKYITLADVRNLVLENEEFLVRDVKNDQDITRSVLLQIIVEQEAEEEEKPLFTISVLQQMIRVYGDSLQGMLAKHLDRNIKLIVRQQQLFRQQMHNVVMRDPVNFLCELTEQNLSLWEEMQEALSIKKPSGQKNHEKGAVDQGNILPVTAKSA